MLAFGPSSFFFFSFFVHPSATHRPPPEVCQVIYDASDSRISALSFTGFEKKEKRKRKKSVCQLQTKLQLWPPFRMNQLDVGKLISHKLIDFRVREMSTCLLASRKPLSASVSVSTLAHLIFTVVNCGCRGSTAAVNAADKGAASSSRAA